MISPVWWFITSMKKKISGRKIKSRTFFFFKQMLNQFFKYTVIKVS